MENMSRHVTIKSNTELLPTLYTTVWKLEAVTYIACSQKLFYMTEKEEFPCLGI